MNLLIPLKKWVSWFQQEVREEVWPNLPLQEIQKQLLDSVSLWINKSTTIVNFPLNFQAIQSRKSLCYVKLGKAKSREEIVVAVVSFAIFN